MRGESHEFRGAFCRAGLAPDHTKNGPGDCGGHRPHRVWTRRKHGTCFDAKARLQIFWIQIGTKTEMLPGRKLALTTLANHVACTRSALNEFPTHPAARLRLSAHRGSYTKTDPIDHSKTLLFSLALRLLLAVELCLHMLSLLFFFSSAHPSNALNSLYRELHRTTRT